MGFNGMMLGLSAPGFNAWWMAWIALVPAILALRKIKDLRQALFLGACFGFGYCGVYCSWLLAIHPLNWMGIPFWPSLLIAIALWVLIAGTTAVVVALTFVWYVFLQKKMNQGLARSGAGQIYFPVLRVCCEIIVSVLWAISWVALFGLLNSFELSIPWALLETTQMKLSLMRKLAGLLYSGSWIAVLILVCNQLIALAFAQFFDGKRARCFSAIRAKKTTTQIFGGALSLSVITLLLLNNVSGFKQSFAASFWPVSSEYSVLSEDSSKLAESATRINHNASGQHVSDWVHVTLFDANLPIVEIQQAALSFETADTYYAKRLEKLDFSEKTLIVLPEGGAVAGIVDSKNPHRNPNIKALSRIAQKKNCWIVTGVTLYDQAKNSFFNALALLSPALPAGNPDGETDKASRSVFLEAVFPEGTLGHATLDQPQPVQFYKKRRLVPFGEYTPFGLAPVLQAILDTINISYATPYEPGPSRQKLLQISPAANSQNPPLKIGSLICFELIDAVPFIGGFAKAYSKQSADLLISSNNLAWFHQHKHLQAQFLAMARLRAAENHLPVVLSSNTGPSALIDSSGSLVLMQKVPAFKAGFAATGPLHLN